jgi:hypothetical protein
VVPLLPSEIVEEEQVEASEDIRETFKKDTDQIEMDLEKNYFDDRRPRECNSYHSITEAKQCK